MTPPRDASEVRADGPRLPPAAPLRDVLAALEAAGIRCALGGSALLAAHGLADAAHDWDLTTDEPLEPVRAALGDRPMEHFGSSGVHADQKLQLHGGVVEVIIRFAFRSGDAVVRIPTVVCGAYEGAPLGSLEAWAVAYALLGRAAKADLVFAHLARAGADAAIVSRLRAEPLPPDLDRRLAALPSR